MATIPQSKPNPRHEAPADATLYWLVREMYKDLKELKEQWPIIKAILLILSLVCGVYAITHGQDVIDSVAKWANLI